MSRKPRRAGRVADARWLGEGEVLRIRSSRSPTAGPLARAAALVDHRPHGQAVPPPLAAQFERLGLAQNAPHRHPTQLERRPRLRLHWSDAWRCRDLRACERIPTRRNEADRRREAHLRAWSWARWQATGGERCSASCRAWRFAKRFEWKAGGFKHELAWCADASRCTVGRRRVGLQAVRREAASSGSVFPTSSFPGGPACTLVANLGIRLRWSNALLADDIVRRGHMVHQQLPRHPDGRQQRWRAMREPMVQVAATPEPSLAPTRHGTRRLTVGDEDGGRVG